MAIVYAKDNSITVYRNGERYGATYTKGTLRPFLKGQSRFLFGQRLSDINPPLAGEVDEACAYMRALTADEVAASFRAGPSSITAEELAEVLSAAQREQLAPLKTEQSRLYQQITALQGAGSDPWKAALADARSNNANPLHAWHQFTTDRPAPTAEAARRTRRRARRTPVTRRSPEAASARCRLRPRR